MLLKKIKYKNKCDKYGHRQQLRQKMIELQLMLLSLTSLTISFINNRYRYRYIDTGYRYRHRAYIYTGSWKVRSRIDNNHRKWGVESSKWNGSKIRVADKWRFRNGEQVWLKNHGSFPFSATSISPSLFSPLTASFMSFAAAVLTG